MTSWLLVLCGEKNEMKAIIQKGLKIHFKAQVILSTEIPSLSRPLGSSDSGLWEVSSGSVRITEKKHAIIVLHQLSTEAKLSKKMSPLVFGPWLWDASSSRDRLDNLTACNVPMTLSVTEGGSATKDTTL